MEIKSAYNKLYAINENGNKMGELIYSAPSDTIIEIDETFVLPEYRGHNVAAELVEACVEKARTENKKIIPICPYAIKKFEQQTNYQDVLYKET